jgi:replication factor C subunit 2/4
MSNLPWIEKYRPVKIDNIIGQENVVKMLNKTLDNNNLPNLLFYGPPGTGKTSTILAIGRELFGPVHFKNRVIELNASDDRGISAVRNKIKIFAKMAVNTANSYPPFKIIVLDEADSMTTDAQSALRKIMEDYSSITRFCFICNYKSKIIDPIASRCAQFNFLALPKNIMHEKLLSISQSEGLELNDDTIDGVIDLSGGDMRKAIMLTQNLRYVENNITKEQLYEINGRMTNIQINSLVDFIKIKSFNEIIEKAKDISYQGYSIDYFLEQFMESLLNNTSINELHKATILLYLSTKQKQIIDGSDEYLQLLDILIFVHMTVNNKIKL